MPTRVDVGKTFRRQLRRLARKHPSLADSVDELIYQLETDTRPGARLTGLGYEAYKVRLPNRSARRGKSGGFRVIYQEKSGRLVLLLLLYSKTERADIPNDVIIRVIEEFG
ncbi:MAG: type II toxin-antitoxin system RelE/ParE family toxin [Chloroflexi bacterium]|nr:type II toxin-antitoxin system RelE/ParE family toxin [Chloroflexota bacterium]